MSVINLATITTLTLFIYNFPSTALNPGCKCIRFVSTFGKEWGLFKSEDYPGNYPTGLRCLLYSFQAPRDYIVQVVIDELNLPEGKHTERCVHGDYLKVFSHLEEDGLNELTPWNSIVCGESRNQTFFSSGRHFVIQFHSSLILSQRTNAAKPFGFLGRFKFVEGTQFESNGRLIPGTKCDYRFEHGNNTFSSGQFFSPNYPSTYPHNIKCAYYFDANEHERVKLTFARVGLQASHSSCLHKTDLIRILDGFTPTASVISIICKDLIGLEILSTGPNALVEFMANSENPSIGFRARFEFVNILLDKQRATDNTGDQSSHGSNHSLSLSDHVGHTQASTLVPPCSYVLTSDGGQNGTFSTPNYPHPYPPKTRCRFEFIGHGKERVRVLFTDFHLVPAVQNSSRICNEGDSVTVFGPLNGEWEVISEFCGIDTPFSVLSNSHLLTVEFNAPKSSLHSRRFSAQYAFVEDFGVKVGRPLKDYPCAFILNSSENLNGTVTSPNHPDFYPRDTECHYFFHGQEFEHVEIEFKHFSLQGTEPCDETTRSDYVEFSNYMWSDPSFERACGTLDPFRVQSVGSFFRVTFRSNLALDATGFLAGFRFCKNLKHSQVSSGVVRNFSKKIEPENFRVYSLSLSLLVLLEAKGLIH